MYDSGERPPIKYYPMAIPNLVSGAKIFGDNQVTKGGQSYLVTEINFFQSIAKVFTGDQKELLKSSIWPGLSAKGNEDDFQFIDYVGESAEKKADWGDIDKVNYDPDKKIDDSLPFLTFSKETSGTASVSYDSVWQTVKKNLSLETSFQQAIETKASLTDSEKFAFVIGLAETKRRWDYALNMAGIDAYKPNNPNSVSDFEAAFISQITGGSLNIQVLKTYYAIRVLAAQKFSSIAGDDWVKDLLPGAKNYFTSSLFNSDQSSMSDAIAVLKANIAELQKEGIQPSKVKKLLGDIKSNLDNLSNEYSTAKKKLGLVPADFIANEAEFNQEKKDLVLSQNSDFSALLLVLDKVMPVLDNTKKAPASLLDSLFNEFSSPFSSDALSDQLSNSINNDFGAALGKPVGMISSISGVNSFFRVKNQNNQKEYQSRVEDKIYREKMDLLAAAKTQAEHRALNRAFLNKSSSHAQEQRLADRKWSDQVRPSEKKANKKGR